LENLIASAQVVLPLLMMMLIGLAAGKCGLLTKDVVQAMNRTLFYIFLPATVFRQIYSLDLKRQMDVKLMLFAVVVILLIIGLSIWLVPRFEKDPPRAGSVAQGLFRGNFIIFGIALSQAVYGERALGLSTLIVTAVNPITNAMAVVCFDVLRAAKTNIKAVLLDIIKTPTIIASLSALSMVLLGIKIPKIVLDVIGDVSAVATPLALILLGATFTASNLVKYRTEIFWVCLLKLFLIPVLVIAAAALLGFRNEAMVAIFAMIAPPIASSSFPVASAMGGDGDLAGQLLIATSVLSVFSIFLLVFFMRTLALI